MAWWAARKKERNDFRSEANLLLGLHNILFLDSPTGAFLDDDAAGVRLAWKLDPVDVQLWTARTDGRTGRTGPTAGRTSSVGRGWASCRAAETP